MQDAIDIIIPTFGRPKQCLSVASAIEKQLRPGDKLVIVWQGARPPSDDLEAVTQVHSAPPNLPRARNKGIVSGINPIILFLDDDIAANEQLLERHRKEYADEKIGCVAGYVEETIADKAHNMPSYFNKITGELVQNFTFPQSCEAISAKGANMSFRRKALEDIGGFDENYKGNALWEEIDCTFRLRASGYKIKYCAEASVTHKRLPRGGCRENAGITYLYRQFANTAYFAARFAPHQYRGSWYRFYKYRLEYLSRQKILWMRHNPASVIAAIAGAIEGVIRYILLKNHGFFKVPKYSFDCAAKKRLFGDRQAAV